ncbi:hypothetical protein JW930_01535 [Candidatus Woesearchaeota archaeon]|nr:hypothetical protein [Candidatus Woesearchaeota archaeon]
MQESILVKNEACLCSSCKKSSSCPDRIANQKMAENGFKIDIVECDDYC